MVIDTVLKQREREGNPIRVGIVGAGYMGHGISVQLLKPAVGIRLAAISNRTVAKAEKAIRDGGVHQFQRVSSASQLDENVSDGTVCE